MFVLQEYMWFKTKYLLACIYVIFPCIKHSSVNYYLVLYFGVL